MAQAVEYLPKPVKCHEFKPWYHKKKKHPKMTVAQLKVSLSSPEHLQAQSPEFKPQNCQ
jgi:hypothetical protein